MILDMLAALLLSTAALSFTFAGFLVGIRAYEVTAAFVRRVMR